MSNERLPTRSIAEAPPGKPELAHDETIINPYYMRQLLTYGIKLGQQQQNADMNPEELLKEAEVPFYTNISLRSLMRFDHSVLWPS